MGHTTACHHISLGFHRKVVTSRSVGSVGAVFPSPTCTTPSRSIPVSSAAKAVPASSSTSCPSRFSSSLCVTGWVTIHPGVPETVPASVWLSQHNYFYHALSLSLYLSITFLGSMGKANCSQVIISPFFPKAGAFYLLIFNQIYVGFPSKPPFSVIMAILSIPVDHHVFSSFLLSGKVM